MALDDKTTTTEEGEITTETGSHRVKAKRKVVTETDSTGKIISRKTEMEEHEE